MFLFPSLYFLNSDRIWQDLPLPPGGAPSSLSLRSCNTVFFLFLFQIAGHSLPLRCPISSLVLSGLSPGSLHLRSPSPELNSSSHVGLDSICSSMIPTFSSAVQIIINLTFSLDVRLGFQNENCKTKFLHLPLMPHLLILCKWHHQPYSSKLYIPGNCASFFFSRSSSHPIHPVLSILPLKHISHLHTPFHLPQHVPSHVFMSSHSSSVTLIPWILRTIMEYYFFTNTNWATRYPSKIFQ